MLKKLLSMALVAILMLTVVAVAVSAEEGPNVVDAGEGNLIYFEPPAEWGSEFKIMYCHAWVIGGDALSAWRSNAQRCKKESDGTYSYDVSGWDLGANIALMFHTDLGQQTYDLNFTADCIGDTVYIRNFEEDTMQSPVDSEKTALVARWRNNGDTVHPVIQISSLYDLFDPDNTGLLPQQWPEGTTDEHLEKWGWKFSEDKKSIVPISEPDDTTAPTDKEDETTLPEQPATDPLVVTTDPQQADTTAALDTTAAAVSTTSSVQTTTGTSRKQTSVVSTNAKSSTSGGTGTVKTGSEQASVTVLVILLAATAAMWAIRRKIES